MKLKQYLTEIKDNIEGNNIQISEFDFTHFKKASIRNGQ